jgi:hypothetical protein
MEVMFPHIPRDPDHIEDRNEEVSDSAFEFRSPALDTSCDGKNTGFPPVKRVNAAM